MTPEKMYQDVCKKELKEINEKVGKIETKIYNGFEDKIEQTRKLQFWQLGLWGSMLLLIIGYVVFK